MRGKYFSVMGVITSKNSRSDLQTPISRVMGKTKLLAGEIRLLMLIAKQKYQK
jgi:hypothetical protein